MDDRWDLLDAMFDELGLVRLHLDSFNAFVETRLQTIVDAIGTINPDIENYYVKLDKIEVGEPTVKEADGSEKSIFPMETRVRNLTYGAPIYLHMIPVHVREGVEHPDEPIKVFAGIMPIMLKSNRCPLSRMSREQLIAHGEDPDDPGGYFIINGSERVLVTQEDLAPNRILIETRRTGSTTSQAKVFSTIRGFRAPVIVERHKDSKIVVMFPSVPRAVPLGILLKAFGVESDQKIANMIAKSPEMVQDLIPVLEKASELKDEEEALDYIGRRVAVGQTMQYRIQRAQQVLDNYLLPHLGNEAANRKDKAIYLAQMARRLLDLERDKRKPDDKDHYANKRLKLAGDLLLSLFRVAFLNLTRDIKYQLERSASRGKISSLNTVVRADVITERLRHALATGNWVGGKAGVSQLLDRTNYMSMLSHLRRVVSPLSRSQPHFEARDLHPTHWGKICPNETPEGPNCGLVKNLALTAYISVGINEREVEPKLYPSLGVAPISDTSMGDDSAQVFLNGRLIGVHHDPVDLGKRIRRLRRKGELRDQVNIAYYAETKEIQINCDAGRVRRPLIIVENGKPLVQPNHVEKIRKGEWNWSDLVRQGLVEYLDAEEEEEAYIALHLDQITEEHSHLEISPAAILGITASLIPYAEHNQSPRNTYEAGMAKQALGLYSSNYKLRVDTRGHLLHYSQAPLVKTRPTDIIGFMRRPAGQNFVCAVLSFQGYNIHDAFILNKASINRGLARSSFFRCYDAEEKKYPGGQEDRFEVPKKDVRGYRAAEAYRHLSESDGVIEPEIEAESKDVLIGRTSPPRFLEEYRHFERVSPIRRETSVNMRHGERGIVDTVLLTETSEGNRLVKVKVRDHRIPELGDKFASRHGQKGIVGLIANQEDLPFTDDGIVPDILINPHAIPSRMTIGQMFESIAAILSAKIGKEVDGTVFEGVDSSNLLEQLKQLGFNPYGKSVMYDGITGKQFEAQIFVGMTYFQKLHHMVVDKLHARARGPIQILTRQPTEGRAREGGLRFGEMERDCLIGHGASLLLKERLLDESDRVEVLVCEKCGLLATYDRQRDKSYCPICGDVSSVARVTMSYAFKLLTQELLSFCITPRLRLSEYV